MLPAKGHAKYSEKRFSEEACCAAVSIDLSADEMGGGQLSTNTYDFSLTTTDWCCRCKLSVKVLVLLSIDAIDVVLLSSDVLLRSETGRQI